MHGVHVLVANRVHVDLVQVLLSLLRSGSKSRIVLKSELRESVTREDVAKREEMMILNRIHIPNVNDVASYQVLDHRIDQSIDVVELLNVGTFALRQSSKIAKSAVNQFGSCFHLIPHRKGPRVSPRPQS